MDVAENWQSEYLQFFLFISATVWLVQRGSPESKEPGQGRHGVRQGTMVGQYAATGLPRVGQGRRRRTVFSNSLLLVMGRSSCCPGWRSRSRASGPSTRRAAEHCQDPVTWCEYLVSPEFWNRTLQNWQSEFLAVGAMVILSIYLRQRGSPESKPVGEPHDSTGATN